MSRERGGGVGVRESGVFIIAQRGGVGNIIDAAVGARSRLKLARACAFFSCFGVVRFERDAPAPAAPGPPLPPSPRALSSISICLWRTSRII